MHHDNNTNTSGSEPPGCLICIFHFLFFIQILDIKHFCKVLSQLMTCTSLNCSSIFSNKSFASGSEICTTKFFKLTFYSLDYRNAKNISINFLINIQNFENKFRTFFFGLMGSMTFLPKKLSGSDEWSWMFEFPSNYIGPLID